jgi:phage shock protein A
MLNQIVIDMSAQLIEAKKQVASSIADEKRLAKQAEQEAATAAEWERRAMMAVRASDDNLAKEALARKKEHAQLAQQFQEQWQKQKASVDQLKLALRALNSKIEEAKRKKNLLIARKKRAEAQKAIQETMSGLKNASAFEAFDQMAGRIEQMEAEAEAGAELAEEYSGDVLANKFEQLEVTTGAEEDLTALKRKMGVLPQEPEPAAAEEKPVRVEEKAAEEFEQLDQAEQDELAQALAELEAQEQQELRVKR